VPKILQKKTRKKWNFGRREIYPGERLGPCPARRGYAPLQGLLRRVTPEVAETISDKYIDKIKAIINDKK